MKHSKSMITILLSIVLMVINTDAIGGEVVDQKPYKVISSSSLNVREQPSVNSQILGALLPGAQVQGVEYNTDWIQIRYDGKTAYVSHKYLKSIDINVSQKSGGSKILSKRRFLDIMKVDAITDGYLGYSDFVSSKTETIGRFGFGAGVSLQGVLQKKIWLIPVGWNTEVGLGYSMKGSAAYPMHYINLKLAPFGYEYEFSSVLLNANVGFFMGIPLSRIETNKYRFKSNWDVGFYVKAMCWWKEFGLGLSYELSFTNVCSANLPLKNSAVFLNVAYRIHNINNYYSK